LKSAKIAVGYVMALWFEELAEFSGVEDIDIVEDTFIRTDIGTGSRFGSTTAITRPGTPIPG